MNIAVQFLGIHSRCSAKKVPSRIGSRCLGSERIHVYLDDVLRTFFAGKGDERTELLRDALRNEGSINKSFAEELDVLLVVRSSNINSVAL